VDSAFLTVPLKLRLGYYLAGCVITFVKKLAACLSFCIPTAVFIGFFLSSKNITKKNRKKNLHTLISMPLHLLSLRAADPSVQYSIHASNCI
jgi:hypothetical protein